MKQFFANLNKNKKPPYGFRQSLLWSIGLILLCTQLISIFWVWHESQEQISILVNQTLEEQVRNSKIEHELNETIAALILPSVVMIILSLIMIVLFINRITAPLQELNEALEHRSAKHLHPLPENHSSLELYTITQKLNDLFLRLNQGLENERRFTADIAHELRTPLAGLRLHLELLLPQQAELTILIKHIDKMTASLEQLLQLARTEQSLLTGNSSANSARIGKNNILYKINFFRIAC